MPSMKSKGYGSNQLDLGGNDEEYGLRNDFYGFGYGVHYALGNIGSNRRSNFLNSNQQISIRRF